MKGKTGRFAKIILYYLRADKQNSCTAVVTGEAVNRGDGEGMRGRRNILLFSRMNWERLTSNDKQQIDSRLRAIVSLRLEEGSKLFVYGHTNV